MARSQLSYFLRLDGWEASGCLGPFPGTQLLWPSLYKCFSIRLGKRVRQHTEDGDTLLSQCQEEGSEPRPAGKPGWIPVWQAPWTALASRTAENSKPLRVHSCPQRPQMTGWGSGWEIHAGGRVVWGMGVVSIPQLSLVPLLQGHTGKWFL